MTEALSAQSLALLRRDTFFLSPKDVGGLGPDLGKKVAGFFSVLEDENFRWDETQGVWSRRSGKGGIGDQELNVISVLIRSGTAIINAVGERRKISCGTYGKCHSVRVPLDEYISQGLDLRDLLCVAGQDPVQKIGATCRRRKGPCRHVPHLPECAHS